MFERILGNENFGICVIQLSMKDTVSSNELDWYMRQNTISVQEGLKEETVEEDELLPTVVQGFEEDYKFKRTGNIIYPDIDMSKVEHVSAVISSGFRGSILEMAGNVTSSDEETYSIFLDELNAFLRGNGIDCKVNNLLEEKNGQIVWVIPIDERRTIVNEFAEGISRTHTELGMGNIVYGRFNELSMINLGNYLESRNKKTVCFLEGVYTGKYNECLYSSEKNTGRILIDSILYPSSKSALMKIDEFVKTLQY